MSATIDQVTHEALSLSVVERARLARTLLDSLADASEGPPQDGAMLARRHELTQRFVSGEWVVELAGYERARERDRATAKAQAKAGDD